MSISRLVSTAAQFVATGTVTTSAIDTTGVNLLVGAAVRLLNGGTFSDSKSNTWTELTRYFNAHGDYLSFFYCLNPTVGTGHTFTFTTSPTPNTFPFMAVAGYSGVATSSAFDVENGNNSFNTTTLATGSVTPSQSGSLVISCKATIQIATTSNAVDSGLTIFTSAGVGNDVIVMADIIETSIVAKNATWTWVNSTSVVVNIAVFKPAAGPPSNTSAFFALF